MPIKHGVNMKIQSTKSLQPKIKQLESAILLGKSTNQTKS